MKLILRLVTLILFSVFVIEMTNTEIDVHRREISSKTVHHGSPSNAAASRDHATVS